MGVFIIFSTKLLLCCFREEADEFVEIGALNGLFVLGRSIGFIGKSLFHIYFTSLHCAGKYELNKLTSLPMCGFIAQLVEHRTGISRRSRVRIPLKP